MLTVFLVHMNVQQINLFDNPSQSLYKFSKVCYHTFKDRILCRWSLFHLTSSHGHHVGHINNR
jgi:hypothetical protein